MTIYNIAAFVVLGLAFVCWAYLMFSTLFLLRKRAEAKTGKTFPGPFSSLKEFWYFAKSDADRKRRNLLILATLAMFGAIFLSMFVNLLA